MTTFQLRTVKLSLLVLAVFAVAVSATLGLRVAGASSHREAPAMSQDPAVDNTDVYAFVSPDRPDSVTLAGCWYPFQEPGGGPNFYRFSDDGRYVINIDNNGDAVADIKYYFTFQTINYKPDSHLYNTGPITEVESPNWHIRQYYTLQRQVGTGALQTVVQDSPVPPNNIGPKSTPAYEAALAMPTIREAQGHKVFVGQREDPFFVDVAAIFDLLTIRPGPPGNAGGGFDTLAGYNCNAIVLQVPTAQLTTGGSPIIGTWMTTERRSSTVRSASGTQSSGNWVQVSRLGMPLVNEAVIPVGLKDAFNGLRPDQDAGALSRPDGSIPVVQDPEVARLLKALYNIDVPPAGRTDIQTVYLTGLPGANQPPNVKPAEMLRLNTSVPVTAQPNRLGAAAGDMQGFPNGRRLTDDVVDVTLRVVAGVLVDGFNKAPNNALGDGVDANDRPFMSVFPYLGTPFGGFEQVGQR